MFLGKIFSRCICLGQLIGLPPIVNFCLARISMVFLGTLCNWSSIFSPSMQSKNAKLKPMAALLSK